MKKVNETETIKNRIWMTAKSRIHAEKRYRHYNIVSHIILVFLSIGVIGSTLLKGDLPPIIPLDELTILLSVFVMAATIVVFGFRFGEIATLHRECYLRLQSLLDRDETIDEFKRCYHEILGAYPNHASIDYESLVLDRTFLTKKNLKRLDGEPIDWDRRMLAKWLLHFVFLWIVPVAVVVYGEYLLFKVFNP